MKLTKTLCVLPIFLIVYIDYVSSNSPDEPDNVCRNPFYTAYVERLGKHLCSGVVVNSRSILTAASCVCGQYVNTDTMFIITGIGDIKQTAYKYAVEDIVCHPKYSHLYPHIPHHNIAVLKIRNQVNLPTCFLGADLNKPVFHKKCFFNHWVKGMLEIIPAIRIAPPPKCKQFLPKFDFPSHTICSVEPDYETSEKNIGAPLICNGQVTAILSWIDENQSIPSVSAKVYSSILNELPFLLTTFKKFRSSRKFSFINRL